ADLGHRRAEPARRRREAAGLDDGQKHRHGFEAIQRPASFRAREDRSQADQIVAAGATIHPAVIRGNALIAPISYKAMATSLPILPRCPSRAEEEQPMDIRKSDTAVVFIDPQNDVLSEKGASWAAVGASVTENRTVE